MYSIAELSVPVQHFSVCSFTAVALLPVRLDETVSVSTHMPESKSNIIRTIAPQ